MERESKLGKRGALISSTTNPFSSGTVDIRRPWRGPDAPTDAPAGSRGGAGATEAHVVSRSSRRSKMANLVRGLTAAR